MSAVQARQPISQHNDPNMSDAKTNTSDLTSKAVSVFNTLIPFESEGVYRFVFEGKQFHAWTRVVEVKCIIFMRPAESKGNENKVRVDLINKKIHGELSEQQVNLLGALSSALLS